MFRFNMSVAEVARNTEKQLMLFNKDVGLGNHGHRRHWIGQMTELFLSLLLDAQRIKQNPLKDYCPDLKKGEHYIESKAVGKNGQSFVYEGRLDKDWIFSRHHSLWYVIVRHRADTTKHQFLSSLVQDYLNSFECLYVIPFHAYYSICRQQPLTNLNSGYGGRDRKVYGKGYRISLGAISDWRTLCGS